MLMRKETLRTGHALSFIGCGKSLFAKEQRKRAPWSFPLFSFTIPKGFRNAFVYDSPESFCPFPDSRNRCAYGVRGNCVANPAGKMIPFIVWDANRKRYFCDGLG